MRQVVSGLERLCPVLCPVLKLLPRATILGLGRCNIAHSIACTCNIVPRVQDIMTIHDEWLHNKLFRKKKSWCYMTPFGEEICSDICPLKLSVPKRVQFTFQERNYKFKLLRCRIPCKNIAIVRKRLSPRTNIRAYFSASFKCFSWHTRLWKLGNIKPVILLGQSDASENTWWIIRTYHALTHSITWLCKAVHTQKNALVQTSLDFL